ncbi:MAG: D-aminoacylase [Bacteroidetes bacterium]|nr:D-aminoacylase [Bacteroidota bacterium]
MKYILVCSVFFMLFNWGCQSPEQFDVIIRNGHIHDGSGEAPYYGDVAINADTIAAIGNLNRAKGKLEIDASGKVIAPGFINVLSWATRSLIEDGRSLSDILQGVTLEVFGEGWSYGPWNDEIKQEILEGQGDIRFDIKWTTLDEYLQFLVNKGITPNVASFVGATTVRQVVLGYEDRAPNQEELEQMKQLVQNAMEDGALGLGTSLIYAPAFYADTEELIELAKVASGYGGRYISHLRSEGNSFLEALEELVHISREANISAEVYHMKAAGKENWHKLDSAIQLIEDLRSSGFDISANMYTYTAGATGLDAAMPPWVQEGGLDQWVKRLKDPDIRRRLRLEMTTPSSEWENLYLAAGSAENILLIGFKTDSLKKYTGKTLAEVADLWDKTPEEAAMDLVIKDHNRVSTAYFLMSEENIRKKIQVPWMSFGSDEASPAPQGNFLKSNPHPRAYGNFARLLGKYVREEQLIPLQEAIRKCTSQPAENLKIKNRGRLVIGYFADILVFDPQTIGDKATYAQPHQLAVGMDQVFVNGLQVLNNGVHTGVTPGRVIRGPGYQDFSK